MSASTPGRPVAIVGAGQSDYGSHPSTDLPTLFSEAYTEMVSSIDRGFDPNAIDIAHIGNLGVGGAQIGLSGARLTHAVGLDGIPVERVENACASGGFALLDAVNAVAAGHADCAIAAGVEKMQDLSADRRKYWLGVSGDTAYERLAGMTFAGVYAIMAQRYLAETAASHEHLSRVAVKNHENASKNPQAQFQRQIDLEKATNAPQIADPLNLYDACPTTDGAASALVVPAERAHEFTDSPVYVAGVGGASAPLALHDRESITRVDAAAEAATRAYDQAECAPEDIDFAEVHDCFTIAELLAYEDLGFAARGEGWTLIADGTTARDGDLPINTSGGLKAKGHPLGATGIGQVVEVFKQLRDEAGTRQVEGTRALTHNVGGSGGAATVCIFEVDP